MHYIYSIIICAATITQQTYSMEENSKLSGADSKTSKVSLPSLQPIVKDAKEFAASALHNNPPLVITTAATRFLSPHVETFGAVSAAGLLASGVGRCTYQIFDRVLGASPEKSYLAFTTMATGSFAALGALALYRMKTKAPPLEKFKIDWQSHIAPKKYPIGTTVNAIKKDVQDAYSEHLDLSFTTKFFIFHGPPGTGKTTTAEHIPLFIEETFLDSEQKIPTTYYHVPVKDILGVSKFGDARGTFLANLIASAEQKAASGKERPVIVIDEVNAVLGIADGRNKDYFNAINNPLKNIIQGGMKTFVIFTTNNLSCIEDPLQNRAKVHQFETLQGNDFVHLIKASAVAVVAPMHKANVRAILENNGVVEDLSAAFELKNIPHDGRRVNQALTNISTRYGAIMRDVAKNSYYANADTELKQAFNTNSYRIALECFSESEQDSKELIELAEKSVAPQLLKATEAALKNKNALIPSPDGTALTTAHHIAPLLASLEISANDVEGFLSKRINNNGKQSFSDVIIACFDAKSTPETIAHTLIAPWNLAKKDDNLSRNNRTAPLGSTLVVVNKKETTAVETHDPALAFARQQDVLKYACDSQEGSPYSKLIEQARKSSQKSSLYISSAILGKSLLNEKRGSNFGNLNISPGKENLD